jgi:rhomboid family GlyGly-CTERM serine protease
MGLRKGYRGEENSRKNAIWRPIIVLALIVVGLGFIGDPARDALAYERQAIASGQIWRLISGHFVHTSLPHMALNLSSLLLVTYLVGRSYGLANWLLIWIISVVGTSAGLWFLEPQLNWYVGLSGVLHGIILAGIIAERRALGIELWVVLLFVVGKLGYEQAFGPLPGSAESTGAAVIINSHLYGAIAGVLAAVFLAIRVRAAASI